MSATVAIPIQFTFSWRWPPGVAVIVCAQQSPAWYASILVCWVSAAWSMAILFCLKSGFLTWLTNSWLLVWLCISIGPSRSHKDSGVVIKAQTTGVNNHKHSSCNQWLHETLAIGNITSSSLSFSHAVSWFQYLEGCGSVPLSLAPMHQPGTGTIRSRPFFTRLRNDRGEMTIIYLGWQFRTQWCWDATWYYCENFKIQSTVRMKCYFTASYGWNTNVLSAPSCVHGASFQNRAVWLCASAHSVSL